VWQLAGLGPCRGQSTFSTTPLSRSVGVLNVAPLGFGRLTPPRAQPRGAGAVLVREAGEHARSDQLLTTTQRSAVAGLYANFAGGAGCTPRLGREGKPELTEAPRLPCNRG